MKRIENKIYIIYRFSNKTNEKSYIGLTCRGLELRKYEHLYSTLKGSKFKFHAAIRKYGIDNFNVEILESGIDSLLKASIREIYYIEYYDSYSNGYNMTEGGGNRSEYELSDESRNKMRLAKLGTKVSVETKLKQSIAKKGVPKSESHRINAANAKRGFKMSKENRLLISERRLGKCLANKNPAAIKINIYDNTRNLKFECNGNFESTCNEIGLPLSALRKSYYDNGKPIYEYKNMKQEVLSRFGDYVGWYAIKL